jgi:hypothetical protein
MIDRAEIEFTLKLVERGVRCEAPAAVMEELCRVYLAWLDAPIGVAIDDAHPYPTIDDSCLELGRSYRLVVE